jgi:hypothetical protein
VRSKCVSDAQRAAGRLLVADVGPAIGSGVRFVRHTLNGGFVLTVCRFGSLFSVDATAAQRSRASAALSGARRS